jgi:hypothetical protein
VHRALLACCCVALLAAGAPPASASGDSRIHALGCEITPPTREGQGSAGFYEDLTAYAVVSAPSGVPVPATVGCSIRIDGYPEAAISGSGLGVVVAHDTVYLYGPDASFVELCTTVEFTGAGDTTPPYERCLPVTSTQIPPQGVLDAVDGVFDTLDQLVAQTAVLDPVLCPLFPRGTVVPGGFEVTAEGDVYVGGELFWDCPPYGG